MIASEQVVFCKRSDSQRYREVSETSKRMKGGRIAADVRNQSSASTEETYTNVLTGRCHKDRALQSAVLVLPETTSIRKFGPFGLLKNRYRIVALLMGLVRPPTTRRALEANKKAAAAANTALSRKVG